ncbi:hypothetical protein H1R20_g10391, partial [Candolleomyces eurysporus]
MTLSKLTTLHLGIDHPPTFLVSCLDLMTLPSLTALHISAAPDRSSRALTGALKEMLGRSGCSLQRLEAIDSDVLDIGSSDFFDILSLSPNLSHLGLHSVDMKFLHELILEPVTVPQPSPSLLSTLKTLDIRWLPRGFTESSVREVFPVLLRVISSRTLGLDAEDTPCSALEDVKLLCIRRRADTSILSSMRQNQVTTQMEIGKDISAGASLRPLAELYDLASKFEAGFCNRRYQRIRYNPPPPDVDEYQWLWRNFDKEIQELESIDLSQYANTDALILWDVPGMLRYFIESTEGQSGQATKIDSVKERAAELLGKWRPFLLRDARKLSVCWRIISSDPGNDIAQFHFLSKSRGDEEIWQNITNPILRLEAWYE